MKVCRTLTVGLLAACLCSTGCGNHSADQAATPGQSASGQTVAGQAAAQKPTPEQETAKQRAVDRGPAIAAANFAATHPRGQNTKK